MKNLSVQSPLAEKRPAKNLMVTPRLPRLPTLAVAHAPAGSHDRWVLSAAMVASRPTVMAPPRSHAPPRAFLAHFNARVSGQRATEARLGVASDAPIENRAGAAFAHGDAGAARHVRDDRRRRYVGARAEPCARSNRANPPRTRRGPRGRAPHTSIIRSKTSVCCVCCAKRAVPRFPTLHAFPRRFRGFVKRETARARRKRSRRDWKNREKESSSRSLFFAKSAKSGKIDRRRSAGW